MSRHRSDFAAVENEKLKGMSSQWSVLDGGWTVDKTMEGSFVNVPPVKPGAKFNPESVPHFTITTTVEGVTADATDSTELGAITLVRSRGSRCCITGDYR